MASKIHSGINSELIISVVCFWKHHGYLSEDEPEVKKLELEFCTYKLLNALGFYLADLSLVLLNTPYEPDSIFDSAVRSSFSIIDDEIKRAKIDADVDNVNLDTLHAFGITLPDLWKCFPNFQCHCRTSYELSPLISLNDRNQILNSSASTITHVSNSVWNSCPNSLKYHQLKQAVIEADEDWNHEIIEGVKDINEAKPEGNLSIVVLENRMSDEWSLFRIATHLKTTKDSSCS